MKEEILKEPTYLEYGWKKNSKGELVKMPMLSEPSDKSAWENLKSSFRKIFLGNK